jgi:hypothetical protein
MMQQNERSVGVQFGFSFVYVQGSSSVRGAGGYEEGYVCGGARPDSRA